MRALLRWYQRTVLAHPAAALSAVTAMALLLALGAPRFSIDASGDSLLLESDSELEFYRAMRARYGADDYLVLTYTPASDLFEPAALGRLGALRDALAAIDEIASVVSILDVPLFESPPAEPSDLADGNARLLSPRTDLELARVELTTSPLYANRLMSEDGVTTAIQLNLGQDAAHSDLIRERDRLRGARAGRSLTAEERRTLAELSKRIDASREQRRDFTDRAIASVRAVMTEYADDAQMYLGGVPMINADMLDYIRYDLLTFGSALLVMLVLLLALVFREPRWVLVPLAACAATVVTMVGLLGWLGWPVTVVSSNFVSLLLILTLSLTVHLAVRYRELRAERQDANQFELVSETVRTKFMPALLTALTTMVAFASLAFSDIRPIIDFGWMMVVGLLAAFFYAFAILPPALMLLPVGDAASGNPLTDRITGLFGTAVQRFPRGLLVAYAILGAASIVGIARLSIDTRFIDYFSDSTEIYRGMKVIDEKLGGTTPLVVVVDAPEPPPATDARPEPEDAGAADEPEAGEFAELDDLDEFDGLDDLDDLPMDGEAGLTATSHWFNASRLGTIRRAHEHLDRLSAVGKVMSLESTMYVVRQLSGEDEPDNFSLSVVHKKLPEDVKAALVDPYLSSDGDQTRFDMRVFETRPNLDRDGLLDSVRGYLTGELGLTGEQVHVTGLFVLYNNVLHSLVSSQTRTALIVFFAVFLMFAVSFRSWRVAAVAVVPNVIGAISVLGLMSAMGVPLDIMTITIAAIVIGIGVDDTIHYAHRFADEFAVDRDYAAAIRRSHASVGRAMYYTTVTIVLGFSVLALSRFVPTIYFGLLTGLAMIVALVANLTLLPLLIARFRAYGDPAGD
jgi:predicted RND superfamily exporter protein